jgi:hypothetical protein
MILFSLGPLILPDTTKDGRPKKIYIPDIPGYKTLKGDFHLHTVFSDGTVWPLTRVDEAVEEGLDAIAITDHIDYQKILKLIPRDHNRPYQITQSYAAGNNILLIKGVEINEPLPPGHFNALFIKDGETIEKKDFKASVLEAKRQGGVIIWNHPGMKSHVPVISAWSEIHSWLMDHQILNGIEIYNHHKYYPKAFEWAIGKNLTIFSNTDNHRRIWRNYDLVHSHRPLTLVFARERSLESVKEAFLEGRTAAFIGDTIRGNEKWLLPLFNSCVHYIKNGDQIELSNHSDLPINLEQEGGAYQKILLKQNSTIKLSAKDSLIYKVINFEISPGKKLVIKFP